MLNLEDRIEVVEDKVDRLESLFGQFMAQTGQLINRLERQLEQRAAQIEQQAEKDRQQWQEHLWQVEERWDKQRAEDRQHWNKRWGELAQKLGTIAEDIVAPNLPRLARVHFGCDELEDFMVRRKVKNKQDPSKRREFDVIAVCADKVLINETKSTPSV